MASVKAFVAGATGYVGGNAVKELRKAGVQTVAHIRPGSSALAAASDKFAAAGAVVDTTPFEPSAMTATLATLAPDFVFILIGTTKKRMKQAADAKQADYEAVDFGLTKLIIDAAVKSGIKTKIIYLSSVGTSENAAGAYLKARYKAEQAVINSGLPYVIARPSIISGTREENRPAEKAAACVIDAALKALGALGAKKTADRWSSITGEALAAALVKAALGASVKNEIIESERLKELFRNGSFNK
jgi:uncharacterized protein YbjT (DUF2867 family)